jgi:hypothetical protein
VTVAGRRPARGRLQDEDSLIQDERALNAHVAIAIAKDTPRGWRIDKPHGRAQIDALIALAMAVEHAEQTGALVGLALSR